MPDSFGKLTPQETQKLIDFVNSKWLPNRLCELCGAHSWFTGETIVAPANLAEGINFALGGSTYPQVLVICANCGNTKYINAVLAGVIPDRNPPKK